MKKTDFFCGWPPRGAFIALVGLLACGSALADPNYHLVGWVNTFVPGAGQWMLGNPGRAASQFAIEGGTFGLGFGMSQLSPMSLDGVPADLPVRNSQLVQTTTSRKICLHPKADGSCPGGFQIINSINSTTQFDGAEHDFTKPLMADILQEFGLKYHMVNVFEAYREANTHDGKVQDPWIDPMPTKDLFLEPFKGENIFSPWVYVPLGLVFVASLVDYDSQVNSGIAPLTKMTPFSNSLFTFNYVAWQPVGSGAPEEMFYRGFMQNEFYHMVESPFFAIAMSTLAFSFSHQPSGREGAAISGTYLGALAYFNHGRLGPGIALHFWSVVVLGLETTALTLHAESGAPPIGTSMQFMF